MTSIPYELPRRSPWPILLSVGLHGTVLAGILYFSLHQFIEPPVSSQPISITMVSPADLEPSPSVVSSPPSVNVPEPIKEPIKEALLVRNKPKPKPILKPKAEPRQLPKPITNKKISPVQSVKAEDPQATSHIKNTETDVKAAPSASPVSVNSGPKALSRIKPFYPRRAFTLGIDGNVRVRFDVNGDGRVANMVILSASPANMFESEVRRAMKKWRYEPGKPGQGIVMNIKFRVNDGASLE